MPVVAVTPAEGHERGQYLQYTLEGPSNKNEILVGAGRCWPMTSAFHLQEGRRVQR